MLFVGNKDNIVATNNTAMNFDVQFWNAEWIVIFVFSIQ